MSNSANLVLKLFHTPVVREGSVHSAEELKMLVSASRNLGFLPPAQELMVRRALELDDVTAREIMTPRQNVFSVPADMSLEEAETRMMEEQHSRVPVFDPSVGPEQVIGLLYSKDVARYMHRRLVRSGPRIPLTVRHVMRDVMVVPETKIVTDLLQDFNQHRRHLAAVVDEFGTTVGIVTVEDALEQLVGEIEDEFDMPDAPTVSLLAGGAVVLDGAENIRDIEDNMQIVLPKDAGYETLAGFALDQLGHIPHEGESFEFEGRRYTILDMQKLRIARVKIEATAAPNAPAASTPQEAER
jgi:CBS domain containing-hemolysin-like protein